MGRTRKFGILACLCVAALSGAVVASILTRGIPSDVAGNAIAGGIVALGAIICIGATSLGLMVFAWPHKRLRYALLAAFVCVGLTATLWVFTDGFRLSMIG
jgi:drug/metabolite transporter (DMT)-like permease